MHASARSAVPATTHPGLVALLLTRSYAEAPREALGERQQCVHEAGLAEGVDPTGWGAAIETRAELGREVVAVAPEWVVAAAGPAEGEVSNEAAQFNLV